ncbi:MAG: phosphotransferase [Pseudomonadota bacterium]
MAGGARNTVLRTVGLGRNLVFKTTTRGLDAIHWLTDVHRHAEDAGLVIPRYLPSLGGNLVEAGWTCEPLIEGQPFSTGDLPTIAPLIAAFHNATNAIAQRPGFRSSTDLLIEDTGGDVDLRTMPEPIVTACRAAWARVADTPTGVVHGDLNPSNLIWTTDGRAALLDWDECRRDLALFDAVQVTKATADERAAALAWEVACCWCTEPERARKLAIKLAK